MTDSFWEEFALQIMIVVFVVLCVVIGILADMQQEANSILEPCLDKQWQWELPAKCARTVWL